MNLTDTPNAPDNKGKTPIHVAVRYITTCLRVFVSETKKNYLEAQKIAFMETVKFLVSFTDNPMSPDNDGNTPIDLAQHEEIVNFLKNLTDAPNTSV